MTRQCVGCNGVKVLLDPLSLDQQIVVGWREWVGLPELLVAPLKAKIDTGARTSALHAFNIGTVNKGGKVYVHFGLQPLQRRVDMTVDCAWPVLDQREVTDSGGHRERRYTIQTDLVLAGHRFPIEITLTNREQMGFRMLVGRSALRGRFLVDPGASFLHSDCRG